MDIVRIINSLIADEYFAFTQYTFLETVAKGKGLNSLSSKFKEIAKDELEDHFKRLCDWASANNIAIETQLGNLVKVANCPMDYFIDPVDSEKATILSLGAEQKAIDAYINYSKEVKDEYPELSQLFLTLANEEQVHKKDLVDLMSEITGSVEETKLEQFTKDADDLLGKLKNFAKRENSDAMEKFVNKVQSISKKRYSGKEYPQELAEKFSKFMNIVWNFRDGKFVKEEVLAAIEWAASEFDVDSSTTRKAKDQVNATEVKNFSEDSEAAVAEIDKAACKDYAMSLATEIFGDKTDESIVDSIVDNAIDNADGDQGAAMGIIKNSYKKNFAHKNKVFKPINLSNEGLTDIERLRVELVPEDGNCETIEGEILRAIDKIYFTFYTEKLKIAEARDEYDKAVADNNGDTLGIDKPAILSAYDFLTSPDLYQYMERKTVRDLEKLGVNRNEASYQKELETIQSDINNMLLQIANPTKNSINLDYLKY